MRLLRLSPEVSLVLALATLLLLLLLTRLSSPGCPVPEEPTEPEDESTWPPAPSRAPPARCRANLSMSAHPDFVKLPTHVRDFMLYRHCRHFPVLREPPAAKCARPVFLLLAIKSSPANYGRRQVLRATWARERRVRGASLRRLFLVGSDRDPHQARKLNRLLEMEARMYGDILQWDFHDSFFNLTLKQSHDPNRHLFVGHLIQNVGPIRVPWSKYFIPTLLEAGDRYPPYCGGGGFLLSRFTVAALRRAARVLPVFPIDDVFLGMCLQQQGLAPASHSGVRTAGVFSPSRRVSSFDPCFYRDLLLVHRFLPFEMLLMWDALSRPQLACGRQGQAY